eukprot:4253595-Prorocentrum_lima.AAC.1
MCIRDSHYGHAGVAGAHRAHRPAAGGAHRHPTEDRAQGGRLHLAGPTGHGSSHPQVHAPSRGHRGGALMGPH